MPEDTPPDGADRFTAGWWEWRGGVNARLATQESVNQEFRASLLHAITVAQDTNDKVTGIVTRLAERDKYADRENAHVERIEDRRANRRVSVRVAIYSSVVMGACTVGAGIATLLRH